jgi:hypothetical protein
VFDLFGDSMCFSVDRCEIILRKGFPWISGISVLSPVLVRSRPSTDLLGDDCTRALRPSVLRAKFGLGTDALQFGFPGSDPLLLCQRQV